MNTYKFDIEPFETDLEFENTLKSFDEFEEEAQDLFPEYGEEESWSFDPESADLLRDESPYHDDEATDWRYESAQGACPAFTPVAVENPGGGRIKDKRLPSDSDLVLVKGAFYPKVRLHRLAARALEALVCEARADGIKAPLLLPTGRRSGYRDPKKQAEAWKRALARYGSAEKARKWVAPPGKSAHQSGRAIDFYLGASNDSRNVAKLRGLRAYKWLVRNAHRFGFYAYKNEPWHWEYNPPASRQSEAFAEMDESFELEDGFGDELEFETGRKCKKDWCSPNYIQWVQKSLNQLMKAGKKLREDGFHDSDTLGAIKSFQKQQGLKPDGEVGPITEKTLISKGASQPPELKQLPCSPTKAEKLIAKLNKYKGDIPLHILLGWIEVESGRQIGRITNLCERGYFQVYPGEAKDRGIKDHQLLSYDEDHSIQGGVKLVNYFVARTNRLVDKYGLPNRGDVFWKVVKLHHWIPSGPEKILADMQAHGVKPSNWSAITSYALDPKNRDRLRKKIKRDPQQGIHNADEMLEKANNWLKKLEAESGESKKEQEFEYEDVAPAPTLLKCGQIPLGETLCAKISLGISLAPNKIDKKTGKPAPGAKFFKVQPMTGIFIPQAYVPKQEVDIVLYLHGHKGAYPGNAATIDDYWNDGRFPFFALREEVNASGRNIVFVAPTLGPLSQAGNLTTAEGFGSYLTQVLAALNKHFARKNIRQEIQGIGKIILAAHSGGGSPMLRIAELKGSSNTSKIAECWGFDCVYGNVEKRWVDWAESHRKAKLFFYSYDTASKSKTLESLGKARNLQNVCVHGWEKKDFSGWVRTHPPLKRSNAGPHFWVPIVYLKERLQNLPCRTTFARSGRPPVRSELEISASPGMDWRAVKNKAVALARQEYERWGRGHRHETNPKYFETLKKYYVESGLADGKQAEAIVKRIQCVKQLPSGKWTRCHDTTPPWSAAFISWVMKTAGAGRYFRCSSGHYVYVSAAKKNRLNKNTENPFWAYRISEVKPEVGDLICNARCHPKQPERCGATFDNLDKLKGPSLHCDIVVDVKPDHILVMGGNTGDHYGGLKSSTVGMKKVPLDKSGKVKNGPRKNYMAVVKFRTDAGSLYELSAPFAFEYGPYPNAQGELHTAELTGAALSTQDEGFDFEWETLGDDLADTKVTAEAEPEWLESEWEEEPSLEISTPAERVLEFVAKWGRNASPFSIAKTYLNLNWKGISYWRDVSKSAKAGRDLLRRIDGLERGARALKRATDEQRHAESKLPSYPLQTDDKAGRIVVSDAELGYVERYYNTAAIIANDALATRRELDRAIAGWDAAVEQANKTNDFARKAAWEAITDLNLRFNNEGGDFRAYLVNARDTAARVESWARMKQYHGAHILGKWTPDWYVPPTPLE